MDIPEYVYAAPKAAWIQTDNKTKYGVAIANYAEKGDHRLPLLVGDTVCIVRMTADWYYGYCTRSRHEKGIFPKCYIHLKEVTLNDRNFGDPVPINETPLVQEITSVLREWGSIWMKLYVDTINNSIHPEFEQVRKMMLELIDCRRLIMSRKLTMDEMKELQQQVTNKIDMGNALLGLDLVVRDEQGNILDPTKTSTISLFRQHELATKRIQEERDLASDRLSNKRSTSFNLLVNVKNFVCRIGEESDVLMSLYDVKQGRFISEQYISKWSSNGMPRDIEMFNHMSVLFTDLGARDVQREKVYLVCQVIRIGRMDLKDTDNKKMTHGLRRPFGVAALDISGIINETLFADDEKQFFIPFMQCGERDFIDNIIKKVVTAKEVNHKSQGIWATLKKLHGDLTQAQKEHPHILSVHTAIARKMGFPDVILPGDVRNDTYVTICNGEFKKGGKSVDKNVTMTVCNVKGEMIKDVISEGAGGKMTGQYKSVVYYHEDKPKWMETLKIAIPIEDFKDAHLKILFKHRSSTDAKDKSEKPFAMSFIKLMQDNGTTLADGTHDLLVYKIDPKRQEEVTMYLRLPATRRELDRQEPMPKNYQLTAGSLTLTLHDSFSIGTLSCSTKLTHNVDLMGLLKWRENTANLENNLIAFMSVDGEEVVKFLQDTLDALFNILMQNSDSDLYDNLVFDCLIFLIGLISDRKYSQFRPVLDQYIKENFSATLAYNKLMVVLKDYISSADNVKRHPSLLKALKSVEYIFKFIIRSRILFAALNESRGKQQFEISLKQVFQTINALMEKTSDETLKLQGAALKYIPTVIADVICAYNAQEFSLLMVEFINSVPEYRLTKQKLVCINDIVHSALFKISDCRRILLPVMMKHVGELMERGDELEVCIKILSDIMEILYRKDVGSTQEDLSTIYLSVLRTIIQTVINMDRKSPLVGNYVAVMTACLRQMMDYHYTQYIKQFKTRFDLTDFLMEILLVFRDLVMKNVYPTDWNEMIMLQNSVFLKCLRFFSNTIREMFSNPFEKQLWNNFFHCAISFLTQESLQLENFSVAKRTKIITRYKDMRRETGFEIRSMWFNLGQHKMHLIPEIVGPILEMTLIPEIELRKATIPIFFDMMQCEFMNTSSVREGARHMKGNFQDFEHEIITQLDALVEGGRGDEQYKDLLYTILSGMCSGHSHMKEKGLIFVEMVKDLLQRLLEYRDIIQDENKENRMSCTVNLLNFYHQIKRKDMYIRYLHKLCDLHLECDNYTEAAFALLQYAKLIHWSDEQLSTILKSQKYPKCQTHRALKEKIYYDIIGYFDKGKMWEKGIELCKELALQYEAEIFDYIQLAKLLKTQADFYDRIMHQMRPEPEYFRVGYYGMGFPSFLQNKELIYRGKEYERLSDFNARLQNQFPNAQLLKTLNVPGKDIRASPNQCLLINAVSPIFEPKKSFAEKKVHNQILKYYKVNEVQKFTYSRRLDEAKNDIVNMRLERTILVTSRPLPGILRWFPVDKKEVFEVSPLENATETMESTNEKIKAMLISQADSSMRIDPFSMLLNGVVDAAVNGGITNYKVFYEDDYLKNKTTDMQKEYNLIVRLKNVTLEQMGLLQKAVELHGLKAPESLLPFHAHIEQKFSQMKQFVEKEFGLDVSKVCVSPSKRKGPSKPQSYQPRIEVAASMMIPDPKTPVGLRSQSVFVKATSLASALSVGGSGDSPKSEGSKFYKVVNTSNGTPPTNNVKSPALSASKQNLYSEFTGPSSRNSTASNNSRSSTSPRGSNGSLLDVLSNRSSSNQVIELTEELTPQRPKRPETERRSRSISGSYSFAKGSSVDIDISDSADSTPSPQEENAPAPPAKPVKNDLIPPPLPQKQNFGDYHNIFDEKEGTSPTKSLPPRLRSSHKGKPAATLPLQKSNPDQANTGPPTAPRDGPPTAPRDEPPSAPRDAPPPLPKDGPPAPPPKKPVSILTGLDPNRESTL